MGDLGVVARDGVLSATTTNLGGRGEAGISCRVDIGTFTVGLRRGSADLSDAEEEEEAEEEVDETVPRERKDESETAVASEPISLRSFFSSSLTSLSSLAIRKFAVRMLTPATADPMRTDDGSSNVHAGDHRGEQYEQVS